MDTSLDRRKKNTTKHQIVHLLCICLSKLTLVLAYQVVKSNCKKDFFFFFNSKYCKELAI